MEARSKASIYPEDASCPFAVGILAGGRLGGGGSNTCPTTVEGILVIRQPLYHTFAGNDFIFVS